jgi:hypothetical protein
VPLGLVAAPVGEPVAGDDLEGRLDPQQNVLARVLLGFAGVDAGGELGPCFVTRPAGVSQADGRIDADGQALFLGGKALLQAPVLAPSRRDLQIKSPSVAKSLI